MLQHLYIRDFAIIHKLELSCNSGLTVLTGETGAGKSIVVDALELALGGRAESGVIRLGCTRAEISASFDLKPSQDAARWLVAHEFFDDGECVVRRVVEIDKPSKAFINSRPVPVQTLRELGEYLVDIHGQHEHQSLLKRDGQRQFLDDYAGIGEALIKLAGHYEEITRLRERLDTLKHQTADREARIELLRYHIQELRSLEMKPDEFPQLEEEHARLANGAEILQGAQEVVHSLYDDENATSQLLARSIGRLESLCRYDGKLGEIAALLSEASIQIDEAANRLHYYLDGLDLDPQRLQWLDDRLASAHELGRKHTVRPEELPPLLERLVVELNDIEDFDTNLSQLEERINVESRFYRAIAAEVSAQRADASKKLSADVTARMQELGMIGGKFEIAITQLPPGEISVHGLERIEFLVSANPGQPVKSLTKVASGGELSRISLALQVVLASLGRIPTLIFDEVDVGVGGRVAEIVGQLLRTLGENRQVFCITHLAQVAALGHQHFQVNKLSRKDSTRVEVQALMETNRIKEIARMIGGVEISKQTLAHAEDMLTRASV